MNSKSTPELNAAISAVQNGGVIAYPTEAVYGFGCDPRNKKALQAIINLKGRSAHKGFIIVASAQHQLTPYLASIKPEWQVQFDRYWPGPFTFVVPAAANTEPLLSGGRDTLAVRVSDHPVIKSLCDALGGALVSTSANRTQQSPLSNSDGVRQEFGSVLDAIVDGQVGELAVPTCIIDVRNGKRLRG